MGIVRSQEQGQRIFRPEFLELLDWKNALDRSNIEAHYRPTLRKRKALAITETELKLIAALASMGLSSQPRNG